MYFGQLKLNLKVRACAPLASGGSRCASRCSWPPLRGRSQPSYDHHLRCDVGQLVLLDHEDLYCDQNDDHKWTAVGDLLLRTKVSWSSNGFSAICWSHSSCSKWTFGRWRGLNCSPDKVQRSDHEFSNEIGDWHDIWCHALNGLKNNRFPVVQLVPHLRSRHDLVADSGGYDGSEAGNHERRAGGNLRASKCWSEAHQDRYASDHHDLVLSKYLKLLYYLEVVALNPCLTNNTFMLHVSIRP